MEKHGDRKSDIDDETELVRRLQVGDEQALEAIFKLYSSKLYNVAHRILGGVADSEEVVQDVFWSAYRKAHSFRGDSQLSTWLSDRRVNGIRPQGKASPGAAFSAR